MTLWVMVQKIYSKIHPLSSFNTHHDVTDLEVQGMVRIIKYWMSQKHNMT